MMTPTVAITRIVIQTCFKTLKRKEAPAVEKNVAGAEQQRMIWFQRRNPPLISDEPQWPADPIAISGDEKHRDIGKS